MVTLDEILYMTPEEIQHGIEQGTIAVYERVPLPVKKAPERHAVRRDYRCPQCRALFVIPCTLSEPPGVYGCPTCGHAPLARYFGATHEVAVNFGYRGEGHYTTKEDARIAQYQFEHL